ncbi:MAG: hypothetical protein N2204_08940 [Anaerolineae bacterium]|nr:hypothetical protein [Anaerolineae bacterium]
MAFFEGLVETEEGLPVTVREVGGVSYYVIDDQGFLRHVEAAEVDRPVLAQFLAQLKEHQDEASEAMLRLLGQDDLFTKAMVDASIRNIDLDQVLHQRLPDDARRWLGMLGFRVVINVHGEVVRVELPAAPENWDEE